MSYEEEIACGVQQMLDADLQFPQESAENAHCNSCKKCNSWIPVTERLPDKCTIVLCYKDGQRRLGYYLGANYSRGVAAFRHPKDQWAFGITHWMPLPEPPEVEV